ncbi:hypothetical protein JRQ81_008606 [Phrynocephalus forsythii]|uniref:Lipocalin/cytosolic fatty-acid binding domain-containing protein n=1 Tax=Phrynocephalus forsythii TaxID=171643 RepID=A0A9Q0XCC4_9SAUR|nr:hypothetical protein JRQ81_008606 [Phrynocephalus forsythii]
MDQLFIIECFLFIIAWLACSAGDIPVHPSLDVQKVSGKWYPVRTAKGDPAERPYKAFTLEPFGKRDLILNVEIPQGNTCLVKKIVFNNVRPGVFRSEDGTTTIHIVDTDYDTYQITHYVSGNLILLHLNGREKKLPSSMQQKFLAWVKKLKFNPEWLFDLREEDLCTTSPKAP